jgi:hypothetical protein
MWFSRREPSDPPDGLIPLIRIRIRIDGMTPIKWVQMWVRPRSIGRRTSVTPRGFFSGRDRSGAADEFGAGTKSARTEGAPLPFRTH